MPKRPRQAHIPSQHRVNRKPKRPFMNGAALPAEPMPPEQAFEPSFADEPLFAGGALPGASGPVDTRPRPSAAGRRLSALRGGANSDIAVRVTPGQLPTYDRGYLTEELRRICYISGGLLAVILGLTLLLR